MIRSSVDRQFSPSKQTDDSGSQADSDDGSDTDETQAQAGLSLSGKRPRTSTASQRKSLNNTPGKCSCASTIYDIDFFLQH
jgi:hypothetical protein